MKIELRRRKSVDGATVGDVYVEGVFVCYSLEDEIREIPGKPVSEWKVKGKTAIPSGTYKVVLEDSPKFGKDTLTLLEVPGYTYIRMHRGATSEHTEGCLLLGMKVRKSAIVGGTSGPAVDLVTLLVRNALALGQEVTITILNPKA